MYCIFNIVVTILAFQPLICMSDAVQSQYDCDMSACTDNVVCLQEKIQVMEQQFHNQLTNIKQELQETKERLAVSENELNQAIVGLQNTNLELRHANMELNHTILELNDTERRLEICREANAVPEVDEISPIASETVDYSTLHLNNYQEEFSIRVEGTARRLSAQGSELWCTTNTILYIYSYNLTLIRSLPLEYIRGGEAAVPTNTGQILVAEEDKGLHVLEENYGHRVDTLQYGWFQDVVAENGYFYALKDNDPIDGSTIFVYDTNQAKQWELITTIVLNRRGERLAICNQTIYLADWWNNDMLFKFSISGELLGELGQYGKDVRSNFQPGALNNPWLSSCDSFNNALLADTSNYRLQVWSPINGWSVVLLPESSGMPEDVVVSQVRNTLWALEMREDNGWVYYIVKYTMQ